MTGLCLAGARGNVQKPTTLANERSAIRTAPHIAAALLATALHTAPAIAQDVAAAPVEFAVPLDADEADEAAARPAERAPQLPLDELPPSQNVSDTVINLAGWVLATGDNATHPFAIIDKQAAQILVFGANGKLLGAAPVLIGSAIGDHAAPGMADRELRKIPMEDRTTPAGRFIAGYGPALGEERALWIDYDNAISIHPVSTTNEEEQRPERLASATPEDNRISHGCINVSETFYKHVLSPAYAKGGMFYILPDEWPLEETIPGFVG